MHRRFFWIGILAFFTACRSRSEIASVIDAGTDAGTDAGIAGAGSSGNTGEGGHVLVGGMGGTGGMGATGGSAGTAGTGGTGGGSVDLLDPWRDSVAYYIFVDRFANGDPSNDGVPIGGVSPATNWQGGDWQGIIDQIKAGYFASLGVNSLWLGAPVDNPDVAGNGNDGHTYSAYHGYWPRSLYNAETRFGSLTKLQELVNEAHNAGMSVVLDYPANHVHELAPIYAQHPDWFWPNSNGLGGNCVCGEGCSWEGPTMERCWFTPYLPDFDYSQAAARAYTIDNVIWWWQQLGVDGFRLGAIRHMDPTWLLELRQRVTTDIEPNIGRHFFLIGTASTPESIDPLTKLDGTEDIEPYANICTNILVRQGTMTQLDSILAVVNLPPDKGIAGNLIGSEYSPRAIHYAQSSPFWTNPYDNGKDRAWQNQPNLPTEQSAFERLANGYTVIMTIPGIPTIYYGDEIGMPGAGDPDNRRFMQWSGYDAHQVMLRDHVAKLGQLRKNHIALRRGTRVSLEATTDTMTYAMVHPTETVYVAINRGDATVSANGLPMGNLTNLLTGQTMTGPQIQLPPRSSAILVK